MASHPQGTGAGATTDSAGHDAGKTAKGLVGAIHGAGEALRGAVNQGVDEAFGSKEGAAKNEAIAERGFESMGDGQLRHADRAEARAGRKLEADVAHTSKTQQP